MNATQSNRSSSGSTDASGSIQSLNLGSYCVDQVAELINWSNARSFSLPKRSPWVQIDTTDQPDPNPASEVAEQQRDMAIELEPQPATELNPGSQSELASTAAPPPDQESPQEYEPEPDHDAEAHAEPAPEVAMTEEESHEFATEVMPETATQLTPQTAQESPASIHESSTVNPPEPASLTMPASPPASASPVPIPRTSAPQRGTTMDVHETATTRMAPVSSEASSRRETTPAAVDSSEYLRRLESLVLDLNMQLARVTGDVSDPEANVTTWLRKRVIELSLENMALHEKLSRGA